MDCLRPFSDGTDNINGKVERYLRMRGSKDVGDNQTLVINNAVKGYSALNRSMDTYFGEFERFSIGFFV